MKLPLSAFLLLAWGAAPTFADTLALWSFEANTPGDLNNSTTHSAAPDVLGTGMGTGFHTSAATDWSTPVGNGSANSWSSTNWTAGDYYQFEVSTAGFENIRLSWDQSSSNTGPRDFTLRYSTDGINFTDFATYAVLANDAPNPVWTPVTHRSIYEFIYDLSSISAIDDDASVFFRLVNTSTVSANGGTVAGTGTNRVDNFTIIADPQAAGVPESFPGVAGLACALVLMVIFRHRLARWNGLA